MHLPERHERIVRLLADRGRLASTTLQRLLQASPATIRRDVAALEQAGHLVRTHGGVMRPAAPAVEAAFALKTARAPAAKRAMAECAASLVPPHATVFLDAGTSTLEAGRRLLGRTDLTLYTNSLPLLNLRVAGQARLIAVGGELREISCALVGGLALDWLQHLRFDCAIIGASGIDLAEGASTTELSEAQVKKALLLHARRVILLADATKWQRPAPVGFAPWKSIHDWVTDYAPRRPEHARLARLNVRVHSVAGR